MRRALLPGLLAVLAGCGDAGVVDGAPSRPAVAVTATLSLPAPAGGAPDGVGETSTGTVAFDVRLDPPDATLAARAQRGATASVRPGRDGRATVRVRDLRPGTTRVTLRATAVGARPWSGAVALRRSTR